MKNDNKAEQTIRNYSKLLSYLDRHTDLSKPEEVKHFVATKTAGKAYKRNLIIAYARYCKHHQMQWEKPVYRQETKQIRIPTKEKLMKLVNSAGSVLSTKLQISMETGLRPVELCNLKVRDVDIEQRIVYPTTAKHGASRSLRISQSLANRINDYIITSELNPNDKLFNGTPAYYGQKFREHRNRTARKLHDANLANIRLYDFRHYFATNLYDKTKDILLVKQQMGHRKIETTLVYTQLLQFDKDDNYTCKVASTVEQATDLIENGFEYVTEIEGLKLFRKRK